MSTQELKSRVSPSQIPPLEPGDHLTREEFERRFDVTPGLKKAELIEGIVYMAPPVKIGSQSRPQMILVSWAGAYWAGTPGVSGGDNPSLRLDSDNMPQPDVMLYVEPSYAGRVRIEDDYIVGGPEFVAEVSSSTVSFDLNTKLRVYQRNAIQEYLVWRVRDDEVDWFELRDGKYTRMSEGPDGILRSNVFPGLWLDWRAVVRLDPAKVLEVLKDGMATPRHAEFVKTLAARKT
jgi:Uma2 family endonuclease